MNPGENASKHRAFEKAIKRSPSNRRLIKWASSNVADKSVMDFEVEVVEEFWGKKAAAAYKLSGGNLKLWEVRQ